MPRAPLLGFAAAILALAVDQADKAWMLGSFAIEDKGRVVVTSWLDLVMVWNRGVSYGLFTQGDDRGRWLLVAVGLAGAILFAVWMGRTRRVLPAVALGLIVGGALSNVIDRLRFGAVADFFLLHVGGLEWYVFNIADACIVAGVIGMIIAWMTERRQIATEA